jgi:hypothetical protein
MSAKQRAIGLSAVAVTLGSVAIAVGTPALASPARTAQAVNVTIHGPAVAGYGAVVHLSGSATPAGSTVSIYFKRRAATLYTKRRTLKSDANGHYATTYVADSDYRYYAVANGVKGLSAVTNLPTATCSSSAAIPSSLPLPASPPSGSPPGTVGTPPDAKFAMMEASNGKGRIAGVASDGRSFAVIARSAGHSFSVLARFNYPQPGVDPGAVQVAAVTPAGGVLASARTGSGRADRSAGYVYTGGHTYRLSHAADWQQTVPVGVTPAGAIIGYARVGAEPSPSVRYYVIRWDHPTSHYKVLVRNGRDHPFPAVAANGSIAYTPDAGGTYDVRLPSGRIVHLGNVPGGYGYGIDTVVGAGNTFVGRAAYDNEVAVGRWNVATAPKTDTIPVGLLSPTNGFDWFVAAGRGGAVVADRGRARYLRTALGALVRMPGGAALEPNGTPLVAVDGDGSVAFTASDGRAHILRCH